MRNTKSNSKQKPPSKPEGFYVLPVYVPTLRTVTRWLTSQTVLYLVLLLVGVGIGHFYQTIPRRPDVRPAPVKNETESLNDFVAREAERLLTTDERVKLIAVTEKILGQDFTRPSAMAEEFTFQRRLAGIDSPAFNAFSDKWAAKVGDMQAESVESMRNLYQLLLQGLEGGRQQTADGSAEIEVANQEEREDNNVPMTDDATTSSPPQSAACNLSSCTPRVENPKPAVQRQRLFR